MSAEREGDHTGDETSARLLADKEFSDDYLARLASGRATAGSPTPHSSTTTSTISRGSAIASDAGGYAASLATGAVAGTAVGTVVGTVVGAGVGVFTFGMIDGLVENGGDVSDAAAAGMGTLADTGEALVDVAGSVVDVISGLFD